MNSIRARGGKRGGRRDVRQLREKRSLKFLDYKNHGNSSYIEGDKQAGWVLDKKNCGSSATLSNVAWI